MLRPDEIIMVNEDIHNQERQRRNQKYCFSWTNFRGHMVDQMGELLREEKFVDVTILCENRYFKAHKIVLCGASPFLKAILEDCPCEHPTISLGNIPWTHLTWILQFIYSGQVSVPEEHFPEFLETAKLLNISTLLCKKTINNSKRTHTPNTSPRLECQAKKPRVEHESESAAPLPVFYRTQGLMQELQCNQEALHLEVQAEEVVEIEVSEGSSSTQNTDQDDEEQGNVGLKVIEEVVEIEHTTEQSAGFNPHDSYCIPISEPLSEATPRPFLFESFHSSTLKSTHSLAPKTCNMCGKIYSNLSNLRQHVNLVHTTQKSVQCPLCGKLFKSELYMRRHLICSHNVQPTRKESTWREKKGEVGTSGVEHQQQPQQNVQQQMWSEMSAAVANLAQSSG